MSDQAETTEQELTPEQEIRKGIDAAKASGRSYYDLSYKLRKSDDLISAMQRLESLVAGTGFNLSEWREESPSIQNAHTIKAAVVWDDNGKKAAEATGYQFPPAAPEIEEQDQ